MDYGSLPILVAPLDGLETGMRLRIAEGGKIEEVG